MNDSALSALPSSGQTAAAPTKTAKLKSASPSSGLTPSAPAKAAKSKPLTPPSDHLAEAPTKPVKSKPATPRKHKPRSSSPKKGRRSKKATHSVLLRHKILLLCLEALGLSITLLIAVMILMGYAADRFAGTSLFSNLLPFAAGVLGFILAAALLLLGWWKLRLWLNSKTAWLSPALSIALALGIGWCVAQNRFAQAFRYYRTLVGATAEAERLTIAHQVYASYRRATPGQLQPLIDRAALYTPEIQAAADAFGMDRDLLYGVAATESSFLPRDSKDGGHGLFQITKVPKSITEQVKNDLGITELSLIDPKHNAFVAAATLQHYLAEMHGDLFLGLLAYNIGPANGGLRFIMQQYGAKDFVTIQPYLQTLPRDYPIRVLSYALAFRLWRMEGKLLAYEEADNAARIQNIGIPGLDQGA